MSILSRPYFFDEAEAFQHLENVLWDGKPVCPKCGALDRIYVLDGVKDKKGRVRLGLKKCGRCKSQFTVRVGERGGHIRSRRLAVLSRVGIEQAIRDNVHPESRIMTDTPAYHRKPLLGFAGHESVNHEQDEYVRGEAYTNTLEGFFSLFKRGMRGVYQHCREKHLHRYLAEFDFRYNHRIALGINDDSRAVSAIGNIRGKRLYYKQWS